MGAGEPHFDLHYLPDFAQTHVHWGNEAILSHSLLPPSPFALNLCQYSEQLGFKEIGFWGKYLGRNGETATAETWQENIGQNRRKLKERIGKKKKNCNQKQNGNVTFGKERELFPLVKQNQGIENWKYRYILRL